MSKFVEMTTSAGTLRIELDDAKAPATVANFLSYVGKGHYDGTIFHRCIKEFMVQGGDPLGRGTGGPGFNFEDEFQSGRRFDKPGLLAMANRGPNTNGSQYFITVIPTTWLNGKHTIFGEIVQGQDVIDRVANVIPKGPNDRPRTDVVIKKLSITKTL